MKKLISYEYRNNKKDFNKLMLILMAASLLLQLNVVFGLTGFFPNITNGEGFERFNTFLAPIIAILSLLSGIFIVVVSVIYFIKLANILKKDIYEGQSYIVFSLPVSGKQIIASKYIIGVFYSLVMPFILLIFNIILFVILIIIANLINGVSLSVIVQSIKEMVSLDIIYYLMYRMIDFKLLLISIIQGITSSIFTISIIFAAIVTDWKLSKVKKNSSMWILYTIIFIIIWGYIQSYIGFDGNTFNKTIFNSSVDLIDYSGINRAMNLNYTNFIINILLELAVSTGLYFYTSHIFSNKIEI